MVRFRTLLNTVMEWVRLIALTMASLFVIINGTLGMIAIYIVIAAAPVTLVVLLVWYLLRISGVL